MKHRTTKLLQSTSENKYGVETKHANLKRTHSNDRLHFRVQDEGSRGQDLRTMIDPDQVLKDLATYGQAAKVTLKAWSPKHSQAGHF